MLFLFGSHSQKEEVTKDNYFGERRAKQELVTEWKNFREKQEERVQMLFLFQFSQPNRKNVFPFPVLPAEWEEVTK